MMNQANALNTEIEAPDTTQGAADYLANLMSGKADATPPAVTPVVPVEPTHADDGKAAPAEQPALDSSNAGLGRAALTLPLFELVATGQTQNHGGANLLMPAARLGATAQAWLTAPSALLTAIGTATVAVTYEAYSVNLSHKTGDPAPTDEVTRYTHFPFDRIVRYQGSYFGVAADGLYLLEGTTDDGADIAYAMKTCLDDFGMAEQKTVASAYLAGRLGPNITVTLHAGEDGAQTYEYDTLRGPPAQNHREKFGRGVKNRYFALGLAGTDALELDSIELEINKLTRRI
jgi:hypothetical protein